MPLPDELHMPSATPQPDPSALFPPHHSAPAILPLVSEIHSDPTLAHS